jgi:hypothetical protein
LTADPADYTVIEGWDETPWVSIIMQTRN